MLFCPKNGARDILIAFVCYFTLAEQTFPLVVCNEKEPLQFDIISLNYYWI